MAVLRFESKIANACSSLFHARLLMLILSRLPGSDICFVQASWLDIEDDSKLCDAKVSFATEFSFWTNSDDDGPDGPQPET